MNGKANEPSSLLRRPTPVAAPRIRLVCLPHAGGAATAYRQWPRSLPGDVEMLAVQYPGRQDLVNERCIDDMTELADVVTDSLLPYTDVPLALFGHSMGALVAYEVAWRLEHRHGVVPRALFVSAQKPPHLQDRGDLHLRGDQALIAEVNRLGDVDPIIFTDPDLRDLVLPAIRGDFHLLGTYDPEPGRTISAPLVAHLGDRDPDVDLASVLGWSKTTTGPADHRVWEGDHFYLVQQEAALLGDLAERLR
ncbi:thioesterase [Solihabitans fulvus]|uniref:Thioesterase n=1 Tax=Solihabitans fulvus TaxID=1892852 RepID=A0A5B2WUB4_9PSEU|nr:alpha/beta fold hydrolase [Solihabitans fulvus]KAA2254460.1 thioesterase [Solihabitans fulvus]